MDLPQTWDYMAKRLHDCVFCGLPSTERIYVKPDYADQIREMLQNAGYKYISYRDRFVLFTTGLQLDRSFSDGQI